MRKSRWSFLNLAFIFVLLFSIAGPARPAAAAVQTAPSGLTTAVASATRVDLAWTDSSDNETGFRIERSLDNFATSPSANFTASANQTSLSDNTVVRPNIYYYRVIAVNGADDSLPSNVAAVKVDLPGAPSDLTAIVMSATRVDLIWTDRSANELGFGILRKSSADNFTAVTDLGAVAANLRTFSDTTIVPQATYAYLVVAFNGVGGSPSNVATAGVTNKLVAGPIDPATIYQGNPNSGVPGYFQDDQGTRVAVFPTVGNGLAAPTQIFDPVVPGNAYSEFLGFGTENFYYDAENIFTMPNGGLVVTVFGIEWAFGGAGDAVPGQELIFNRTRVRVDVPMAGTYVVQHPWGTETFIVTAADMAATGGKRAINYTADIGTQRDFATATNGPMTRFLHQTVPPPPAGWIGDGASVGPVTGSPTGFNAVKVTGPAGSGLGGPGTDFFQSNNFMVSGRMPTAVTPLPGFTKSINPVTGIAPADVTFTDTSTGAPTKWLWDFGDGATSNLTNPVHTYNTAGNYLVRLTVTNAVGTVSTSQTVSIFSAPVASFTHTLPNSLPPVSINFTDTSTGTPASWLWNFGDNTTSTLQNPSHVYATAGNYTITLTVTNVVGTSNTSQTLGISPNLVASFTNVITPANGIAPVTANLTDTSTGNITGWLWNFGDTTTSTSQNATKTYNAPGNYTITLTVTDAAGSAATSQVVSVFGAQTANFTMSAANGPVPLTVSFTDTTAGNPASWLWNFGDGATSTLQNPTRTFTAFGRYTVTLTATNPTGSASVSRLVTVSTANPATLNLQVGPIDPNTVYPGAPAGVPTGIPSYYEDDLGTRITLLPLTADQVFDPVVAGNAYSEFLGFGTEAFYWVATTVSPTSVGQFKTVFGIEHAFGGAGDAVPGEEFVFARTRIVADVPVAGNYTFQHPYGTQTIEVTPADLAGGGIFWTADIGVARDFLAAAAADNGNISRFLRPVAAPPAGLIGNGAVGAVTGSPLTPAFNKVRLTGPAGVNLDGAGNNFVETDQFSVSGRLFTGITPGFTIGLNPANGLAPVTATFTDTTTGNITARLWDFGDGSPTSALASPVHIYSAPGTYTVRLTVTDNTSVSASTARVLTVFGPLTASFTKSAASGTAPLTVTFTDTSTGVPASWLWNFGDGTTSALQNAAKVYTVPGTYTVTLTVTNPTGSANTSQTVTVAAAPVAPVASFTRSAASGVAPLTVNFTDTSTGVPTSWSWSFGDNTATSTLQNPSHVYSVAGTYTITLTVTNAAGTSSANQTVIVTVSSNSGPGNGGGGGGGATPPGITLGGLTSNTGLVVSGAGIAQNNATLTTTTSNVQLTVAQGTKMETANGLPITALTAAPLATTPPKAPPNTTIVLPVDFGPDGAKFNPPLTLTMKFDPATLPAGIRVDKLKIAYWDGNGWVKLGKSVIDVAAGTISGEISHFTTFAILAEEEAPAPSPSPAPAPATKPTPTPAPEPSAPSTPAPTIEPAPAPTPTPAPSPTVESAPEPAPAASSAGLNWGIIAGIIGAVAILLAVFMLRRRIS